MQNFSDRTKFLMSYDNRKTLNENTQMFEITNSVVITDWLSPDEKFIIFLDELYDIETKTKLGNIWENFDNFKIFLKHSFEIATNVPQALKESILDKLNNQLLIESKTNYSSLKPLFKQILSERTWGEWAWDTTKDFGNWAYEKGSEAVKNISDFASTSYEGAKKLLGHISRGEWNDVLSLLASGAKYFARRLRDAMYHPVGMVVDILLVASGIGKSVQWIPWAIIVALDIYEIVNNDFEDKDTPEFMRYIFLGLDILGLVTSGGVSGALRTLFGGVRTEAGLLKVAGRETLESMSRNASKVPGLLGRAAEYLSTKFPAGSSLIKGILGSVEFILSKMVEIIGRILKPKPIIAGTAGAGILYGAEKGMEKLSGIFGGEKQSEVKPTDSEINKDLMSGDAEYTV
jgi:hypothetical protein